MKKRAVQACLLAAEGETIADTNFYAPSNWE